MASESYEIHKSIIILMVLGMCGKGAACVRIKENAWTAIIFMVLDVGGRGAAGFGINKKCIGQSLFPWFWKWAGSGAAGFRIARDA